MMATDKPIRYAGRGVSATYEFLKNTIFSKYFWLSLGLGAIGLLGGQYVAHIDDGYRVLERGLRRAEQQIACLMGERASRGIIDFDRLTTPFRTPQPQIPECDAELPVEHNFLTKYDYAGRGVQIMGALFVLLPLGSAYVAARKKYLGRDLEGRVSNVEAEQRRIRGDVEEIKRDLNELKGGK